MDGVSQVTQCPIGPQSTFSYNYTASPSGTFWYHSHSGAQRTDGLFGALIVKEREETIHNICSELQVHGVREACKFEDLPEKHTLTSRLARTGILGSVCTGPRWSGLLPKQIVWRGAYSR